MIAAIREIRRCLHPIFHFQGAMYFSDPSLRSRGHGHGECLVSLLLGPIVDDSRGPRCSNVHLVSVMWSSEAFVTTRLERVVEAMAQRC